MITPFDIFRVESGNKILWLTAADDLETAKKHVEALMKTNPGEYLIRSLKTGHRITIKADGAGWSSIA